MIFPGKLLSSMEDDKSVMEDCQSVWGIGNSQGCPLLHASNDIHAPSKLACFFFKGWPGRSSIARVERAHSYRARSASRRTTRLPFSSHALREHRRSSTSIPSFDQRVALARPGTLLRIAGRTFALPCIALSAIHER